MRKFSKIMLVTAAVAGIAGVGMSIGGVAMGATITGLNLSKYGLKEAIQKAAKSGWTEYSGWEQDWDETEELDGTEETAKDGTTEETYLLDDASKLNLSISAGELYLKEYDGKQIKVEVSGKNRDKVRVGQDEDTLVLESIGRTQDREITVWYPKETKFTDTSVEVMAGTVNLENDFYAKKLEVQVAAGELLSTHAVTADKAEFTVGTGNVELDDLKIKDLEADCGIGNIDLTVNGKESDYNYQISCAAGSVDIGDTSYSGLGHEKDISNPGASGKMELDCGVGNITVDFAK